jgi:hypothetical protein
MPTPQKGYKTINHYDVQYRWIMRNRGAGNELHIVASAPVNGQGLIASLPRVVSLDMITEAIDFGNANGWKHHEVGEPFLCHYARRGFSLGKGGEGKR